MISWLAALLGADASRPHINAGINPPFATAKPSVTLSSFEEQALASGQTVMRQVTTADGKGGRALAVQDVAASSDTVWSRILAFPEYPKMVAGVQVRGRAPHGWPVWTLWLGWDSQECSNYETRTHRNGTQTIKTRMKLGIMGVKLEYFIDHTFAPKLGGHARKSSAKAVPQAFISRRLDPEDTPTHPNQVS